MPDTSWLRYFLAQEDSDIDGWLLPIFIVWIQTLFILRYSILKILKGLSEFCDELFLLVCENWIQIDSPYMKWKSLNVLNQSSPGDRERLKNTKAKIFLFDLEIKLWTDLSVGPYNTGLQSKVVKPLLETPSSKKIR